MLPSQRQERKAGQLARQQVATSRFAHELLFKRFGSKQVLVPTTCLLRQSRVSKSTRRRCAVSREIIVQFDDHFIFLLLLLSFSFLILCDSVVYLSGARVLAFIRLSTRRSSSHRIYSTSSRIHSLSLFPSFVRSRRRHSARTLTKTFALSLSHLFHWRTILLELRQSKTKENRFSCFLATLASLTSASLSS